jgi:hypothetical protein
MAAMGGKRTFKRPFLPRTFIWREPQEAGGIVVENVADLFRAQEGRILYDLYRALDSRPDHLRNLKYRNITELDIGL